MLLCRILQGLAVGGEYVGSVVFLTERAPAGKRGLDSSWPTFGGTLGFLLGSAMGPAIYGLLPPAEVTGWGWRIPFLRGVAVGVTGFLIRRQVSLDAPPARSGFPLLQALRLYPVEMLKVVGISVANAVGFYLMFSYIVTWLQLYAHVKPSVSLMITSINMALMLLITPLSGMLSDRLGRKTGLVATAVGVVILSLPL